MRYVCIAVVAAIFGVWVGPTIAQETSSASQLSVDESVASAVTTPEDLRFLIPGHAGGGWDTMSRTIGDVFLDAGIIQDVSYENKDGNNGGVGLSYVIENASTLSNTLMLNTTQIVIRSLNGTYSNSYAELEPIAAPLGDFAAFVVHPGSEIQTMADLIAAYQSNPASFAIGGGSAPQDLDHLIAAMVIQSAIEDATFDYVQFDAPEPALAALVAGDVVSLTTEYTRALTLSEQGIVRIIGTTAPDDFALPSGIQNMREQGIDMELVLWTGFFAPPGTDSAQLDAFDKAFSELYQTEAWTDLVAENGWITPQFDALAFGAILDAQHAETKAVLEKIKSN